jgi:drug/metabolite transporter (DMT)-like permease
VNLSTKPVVSPVLGLSVAILAVSTSALFIRFAQVQAPSLAIAAWRLTLASCVLVPLALRRNRAEIRRLGRATIGLLILSGIFLCFHFASWITSLEYTSVTSSVVLVTTNPLWVALLSPLVLRERLSKMVWMGLLLALVGGTVVAGSDVCQIGASGIVCQNLQSMAGEQGMWGNFLALVGAWCAAGYILIGRRVRPHLSLLSYTAIVYGVAAVGLIGLAGLNHTQLFGFEPVTFLWFALLALIPQLIGHSTYNWALKYLSATTVSVVTLGEPIGSSLLAFLFLKEPPTGLEIVGGGVILLGIYLSTIARPGGG